MPRGARPSPTAVKGLFIGAAVSGALFFGSITSIYLAHRRHTAQASLLKIPSAQRPSAQALSPQSPSAPSVALHPVNPVAPTPSPDHHSEASLAESGAAARLDPSASPEAMPVNEPKPSVAGSAQPARTEPVIKAAHESFHASKKLTPSELRIRALEEELARRLQDLPEEHLRATDDLRRDSDYAAGVPGGEALGARGVRGRVPIALFAGIAAALVGAIALYVFAREPTSAKQPMQVTTHVKMQANPAGTTSVARTANPASTAKQPTKSKEPDGDHATGKSEPSAPPSPSATANTPDSGVTTRASESRAMMPVAIALPAVLASVGVTREPVAVPPLRDSATRRKPTQAAPTKKAPIKTDTPPAEPKPAVDEILFKSR